MARKSCLRSGGNSIHYGPDPERLAEAMLRLRPREREVLELSSASRLSYRAIAERLGIPVDQVERHLAAALCKLDRALARHGRPWWQFW